MAAKGIRPGGSHPCPIVRSAPRRPTWHTAGVAGRIDYRMRKLALVRQVTAGTLPIESVCDAHPELLRAARNVGTPTARTCPICRLADDRADVAVDEENTLRQVTYVYGDKLRGVNGRVVWMPGELDELRTRYEEFTAYVVEVCLVCGWNHLVSSVLLGRAHAS